MQETGATNHDFDYESLVQRLLLLLKNVVESDDNKQAYVKLINQDYDEYMKLWKELQEKINKRLEVKLDLKKNLDQVNAMVLMNQDINQKLQEELAKNDGFRDEMKTYAKNLKSKKVEMDEELDDLKLRYEGVMLQKMIEDEEKELEMFCQTHKRLEQTLEKQLTGLSKFPSILPLSQLADELRLKPEENIKDLNGKIASTEGEIQSIIRELDKKVAMLQDFQ